MKIIRTDSEDPDFLSLVKLLDQDLAVRDGEDHAFYNQFNQLDKINHVLVAYDQEQAVACGALRAYAPGIVEVKRMFVRPEYRGRGIAGTVLTELERWAGELGYDCCRLETGIMQPEAIRLYQKSGYGIIANYGPYAGVENSICMEKWLAPPPSPLTPF